MLQRLRNSFAFVALAIALAVSPVAANADVNCEEVGQAYSSSVSHPFPIVVLGKPGRHEGVGTVPQQLVAGFEARELEAACFIDKYVSDSGEPEYGFLIAGDFYERNGKEFFTYDELKADKTIIADVMRQGRIHQAVSAAGVSRQSSD